jgi:hypothetical protein
VLALALSLRGYDVLDSVMAVLVVDMMALALVIEIGRKVPLKEVSAEITAKIENIEKVCQSILNSASENPLISKLEETISKQREDVNYILDRMSRKVLELEEKINKFGFSLAEHLEDKLKIDTNEETETNFPIGETVYIEPEEEEEEENV